MMLQHRLTQFPSQYQNILPHVAAADLSSFILGVKISAGRMNVGDFGGEWVGDVRQLGFCSCGCYITCQLVVDLPRLLFCCQSSNKGAFFHYVILVPRV